MASQQQPLATHTVETLIGECVGRYITSSTGAVQLANLINHRTYAKCWAALMTWLDYQSRHGHSAALPPLGVVLRSKTSRPGFVKLVGAPSLVDNNGRPQTAHDTKDGSTNDQETWAAFRFNAAFVDQYRVVAKAGAISVHSLEDEGALSTVRATAATLAKLASTEPQTVTVALSHIFKRLGEVLAARESVLIDCRVGSLIGDKNGVEFVFHHLPEPSAEDRPRADANLLRRGMRPLKTRLANETRALRHKYRLQSPPRGRSLPAAANGNGNDGEVKDVTPAFPPDEQMAVMNGALDRALTMSAPSPRKADTLPHSSTRFRRTLKGTSPMKTVRQNLEDKTRTGAVSPRPYSSHGNGPPLSLTFPSSAASAIATALVPRPPSSPAPGSLASSPSPPPLSSPTASSAALSLRAITYSSGPSSSPTAAGSSSAAVGSLTLVLRDATQSQSVTRVPPLELSRLAGESKELMALVNSGALTTPARISSAGPTNGSNGGNDKPPGTASGRRSFRPGKSLPPVLDSFARTQAAVFSDERFYHSASAKIASFLTPEAANWHIDLATGRYKETKFVPFEMDRLELSGADRRLIRHHNLSRSEEEQLAEQQTIDKSYSRFEFYVDNRLDDSVIAPINDQWIKEALRRLNTDISGLSRDDVAELMKPLLAEIRTDYARSIKRSILDYVLRNRHERERLSIPIAPPLAMSDWSHTYGYDFGDRDPFLLNNLAAVRPDWWRESLHRSMRSVSKNLFINNDATLKLLSIWSRYEHLLLVAIPTPEQLPLSKAQFDELEEKHNKKVRKQFDTDWWLEVEAVFEAFVKENGLTDENSTRFFESVATLMSNQLRTIVVNSAEAYYNFFLTYQHSPTIRWADHDDPKLFGIRESTWITLTPEDIANGVSNTPRPLFVLPLNVRSVPNGTRDGTILRLEFEHTLAEMERIVIKHLDAAITGLKSIFRIEKNIFAMLDDGQKYLTIGVDDDVPAGASGPSTSAHMHTGGAHHHGDNETKGAGEAMKRLKKEVSGVFARSIRDGEALRKAYEDFQYLLDEDSRLHVWLQTKRTLAEYRDHIAKYKRVAHQLSTETSNFVRSPMLLFDCTNANQYLIRTANALCTQILSYLASQNIAANVKLCGEFKAAENALIGKKSTNAKEYVDLQLLLARFRAPVDHRAERHAERRADIRGGLESLNSLNHHNNGGETKRGGSAHHEPTGGNGLETKDHNNIKIVPYAILVRDYSIVREQLFFILDQGYMLYPVTPELLKHIGDSHACIRQLDELVRRCETQVRNERDKFEDEARATGRQLASELNDLKIKVMSLENQGDRSKLADHLTKIHGYKESIQKLEEAITEQHLKEHLMNLPTSDTTGLADVKLALEPFDKLWNLLFQWNKAEKNWMHGPIFKFDGNDVEAEVDAMFKSAYSLHNLFKDSHKEPADVAAYLKAQLTAFKPFVPLMHVLCNKGMRDRHWTKISDIVHIEIRPNPSMTLKRLLDFQLQQFIVPLTEVSDQASKEWAIEKAVDGMKLEWANISFVLKKLRETQTFILVGDSVDEVHTVLDDHIVKTQIMKGSPFAKPFALAIKEWQNWLNFLQQLIDVWLKVQAAWIYLEPVFGAEDISKQMPAEGNMFKSVDSRWRDLMSKVNLNPRVANVTNIPHILGILQVCKTDLDTIQTELNAYLETKRRYFPRFYFLSNDELLAILSETKDPLRVQPHLQKCFEGIHRLEFKDNLDIVAMQSKEGEVVQLKGVVNPPQAGGLVERWLKEVEQLMRETVLDQAQKATKAYAAGDVLRTDWVTQWPGQIVLAVNQIFWTQAVSKAIKKGRDGLRDCLELSNKQLADIVVKVRGRLTDLDRITLGALIVIDVHARDVVAMLAENKVTDTSHFDWISQMRYYWDEGQVKVRMITSTIDYGCEYIGNTSRLVITSLTDRCYRTLMTALQLRLGGAPEGPAGTGKTETVKDLAKAVAIQCIVFNCSDGLDFRAMGKFFKGLASSGAWACFDEFNRIELEVLSVVAQQIQTIQRAKEQRLDTFFFEGTEITLRSRCSVFITMNPGYAGRSELPDNLKAQFRTVAMMVPDYGLIAQILLYSYGFIDAQNLARKIVATYKLCSEQLSSQDHYDYGMRAVRAVLTAAQSLKQKFPKEREPMLILRALIDVNLPKFLSQDIPLFEGIVSDLFPATKPPTPDYGDLMTAIRDNITKLNLQPDENFIMKVLQLYETILVRHGLMIVGLPFAGKTTCYRVLAAALADLDRMRLMNERAPKVTVINPKAVTIGELYGSFDAVSHDWSDGILARKFINFSTDTSLTRKWLLFDGPVDAIWVENMNTVLDDSKKLCLVSGSIYPLNDYMNVMFEVRDLAVASPATVSRCGMVYMDPGQLGWKPLLISWLTTLPRGIDSKLKKRTEALFDWLVPPCLKFVHECNQYSPTSDTAMVVSLMSLMHTIMQDDFIDQAKVEDNGMVRSVAALEAYFLFACVWTIGCIDEKGRRQFDHFFREQCKEHRVYKLSMPIPPKGLVFEYSYDSEAHRWTMFDDQLPRSFDIPPHAKFTEILVPTEDTLRYKLLLNIFVKGKKPCLFVGPTGTGKTMYIESLLINELNPKVYDTLVINFSAQTRAKTVQSMIDDKLDRRQRGFYGPPGGKQLVVFIDDMNMPKRERYGAQPPIELLRQYMDHGGWYDLKELSFRSLVDIQFVAAMGPTGGGRHPISDRFLRHFATIAVCPFDDDTMSTIFGRMVKGHFFNRNFSMELSKLADPIVAATKDVFTLVSEEFKPTPEKSHYTYNLRDFAKVIQGMTMSTPEHYESADSFIRLWVHEVHRVFCDPLVDDADQLRFLNIVRDTTKKRFAVDFDKVFEHLDLNGDGKVNTVKEIRNLFFGDYISRKHPRAYIEIDDPLRLQLVWKTYLTDYNALSNKPMNLVMFRFAIEHASRIVRILKQESGNALLIGVGGSGKQSLTRLAASVMDYDVVQIQLTRSYGREDWHTDLKKLLKKAGGEGKPTVFLFSDSQMRDESFLEDINSLLNSGQVPALWNSEEKAEVVELVRSHAKRHGGHASTNSTSGVGLGGLTNSSSNGGLSGSGNGSHTSRGGKNGSGDGATPEQLWMFFEERVRENLHIVLCMSPIGEAFKERLRMFPSLVNCCTTNWFQAWPHDALESVAADNLHVVDMDEKTRASCVEMCLYFHRTAEQLTSTFWKEQKRHTYVTPTSYLELISLFLGLLDRRRRETAKIRGRYQTGLDKLLQTEAAVKAMQIELQSMQPDLIRTSEETEAKMVDVNVRKEEAQKIREGVHQEEQLATRAAEVAKAIERECASELGEAMPILRAAEDALDTLTPQDIGELRSLKNPTRGVRLVMECLCIMKELPATRIPDPTGSGKIVTDYWATAQKFILADLKLLRSLKSYPVNNVRPGIILEIRRYMRYPEFQISTMKNVSRGAVYMLLSWIYAVEQYDRVFKQVKPKQEKLEHAKREYEVVKRGLDTAQAELKTVTDEITLLTNGLAAMQGRKVELEMRMELCRTKLDRATKLLTSLKGEQGRWTTMADELGVKYEHLTGDVLLSSAVIAYLGPFTQTFRASCIADWSARCRAMNIPCSETFSLSAILGDAVQMKRWTADGLPNDSLSMENALIISKSRRWPLMIDPQGQANRWIRTSESKDGRKLLVVKATDNYLKVMASAIQFGTPCLLENVGEDIDPTLEPLLLKQSYTKGTTKVIKFGDADIEFNDSFKLYMTTKLRNPHYLPEVATKVVLLNFMITLEGLEDQLLGRVVNQEEPDLEARRQELVDQSAAHMASLKGLEDKILAVLEASKGIILDDEAAIDVLHQSKELSVDLERKQQRAMLNEEQIDKVRKGYQPTAFHASALFFCIGDLVHIDPMYQFSLEWFIRLFEHGIQSSAAAMMVANGGVPLVPSSPSMAAMNRQLQHRITSLNDYFSYLLYTNICRSLFEKDKLLFSFMLCARLQQAAKRIDNEQWRFLLTGGVAVGGAADRQPNPAPEWLADRAWNELIRLSAIPAFSGLAASFANNNGSDDGGELKEWRVVYESPEPHLLSLPGKWKDMTTFQRLCIIRSLRPDKLVPASRSFIQEHLGAKFISPPPFDLEAAYRESSNTCPLIFVLSPGSDPMAALVKYASDSKFSDKVQSISLGQGQGPIAEKMIEKAARAGSWVVLQNCHLAISWMPKLEAIAEDIIAIANGGTAASSSATGGSGATSDSKSDSKRSGGNGTSGGITSVHPDFRLWLTSYPTNKFPVSILQNGVKLTNEPPQGLRNNLLNSYLRDPISDEKFFTNCRKPAELKTMVFALSFFHALVQERLSYGPLGWNVPYGFNESDLRISVRQLHMFLNESPDIPYKALRYLTGECNYGGRVTDDWDRRTLNTLLETIYTPEVHTAGYTLMAPPYHVPSPDQPLASYLDYIRSLPSTASPDVFGLHGNADITREQKETVELLESIMLTESRSIVEQRSEVKRNETLEALANDIMNRLPKRFNIDAITTKYPVAYNESMHTVLAQECLRYNKLLDMIRSSLESLLRALLGTVVMSAELELVGTAMFNNIVPQLWRDVSYPSLKPLGSYITDLIDRLQFFQRWIDHDIPSVMWISGLFFPQSVLTGVLQNYARSHRLAIDEIHFDFDFSRGHGAMDTPQSTPEAVTRTMAAVAMDNKTAITTEHKLTKPTDGIYIRGLFLEGARWDFKIKKLVESLPKVLYSPAPIIWLRPVRTEDASMYPAYECPVYRTSDRRGQLSTTGHSTNFVMSVRLPTNNAAHMWVQRGVAMVTQLSE